MNAFIERWRPEMHTFPMPLGECIITLQDLAYQLGLPIDGQYVNGCLTNFERYIDGGRPAWEWFEELLGILPHANCIVMVIPVHVSCGQQEREKLLQSWIFWRFSGFWPEGFDVSHWPLASKYLLLGYTVSVSTWMPYCLPDAIQVVYPEILEPRHMTLWRAVTTLIYFVVDQVLPQLGGVQHRSRATFDINFLILKNDKGGDQWFSTTLQSWHIHWTNKAQHVLRFDVVPNPRPSHAYLEWWHEHDRRFLLLELFLGDPRAVVIPAEVMQRGPGQVPDMDQVPDVLDRCRVERRCCVRTRSSQREWRWHDNVIGALEVRGRGRRGGKGLGRQGGRGGGGGRGRAPCGGRGRDDDDDDSYDGGDGEDDGGDNPRDDDGYAGGNGFDRG
ncbi:hypothetical protein Ahy_B09g095274 [Arachis hypogaea]|uniref:Aminotransferase-like plant mobile domain-containing protein n=1 Tax=Arachis hypogaea TaxID=3818 RepID=A0A444XDQ7_ARAHY|nr:hypothetical protein Ahy_B09g095274 [Arachis hypogaea]